MASMSHEGLEMGCRRQRVCRFRGMAPNSGHNHSGHRCRANNDRATFRYRSSRRGRMGRSCKGDGPLCRTCALHFIRYGSQPRLRLARAFTGKPKLVRFICHFHGWQDRRVRCEGGYSEGPVPGVLDGLISVVLIEPGNEQLMRETLASRDDIAGVILEPTGASFGSIPVTRFRGRAARCDHRARRTPSSTRL